MEEQGVSLGKRLASADKRVRDKTVKRIAHWLKAHQDADELDFLKLWKALFYCMWMSDKVPVQQELASDLASMVHHLDNQPALLFFRTFVLTMQREWPGLDKWRLDKFFSLVRKAVHEMFVYTRARDWDADVVAELAAVFADPVLKRPPAGLRYHITDLFVSELTAVDAQIPNDALQQLLEPFVGLLQTCDDSALFKRVVRDVFEPIVNAAVSAQAEDGSGDSDDGSGNDGAASNDAAFAKLSLPQLYGRLQVVARSPKTIERQRAKAYKLARFVKEAATSAGAHNTEIQKAASAAMKVAAKQAQRAAKRARKRRNSVDNAEASDAAGTDTTAALSGKKRARSEADTHTNGNGNGAAVEAASGAGAGASDGDAPDTARSSKKRRRSKRTAAASGDAPSAAKQASGVDAAAGDKAEKIADMSDKAAKKLAKQAKKLAKQQAKKLAKQQAQEAAAQAELDAATKQETPKRRRRNSRDGGTTPTGTPVVTPEPRAAPQQTPRSVRFSRTKSVRVFKKQRPIRSKTPAPDTRSVTPIAGVLKRTSTVTAPRTDPVRRGKSKSKSKGKHKRRAAADFF